VASDVPFGIVSGITPLSLAAGFRPARFSLLRRAFASWEAGLRSGSRSPVPPATFVSDDEDEIYAPRLETRKNFDLARFGYPPLRANI
jgi:hypothetical protein